jgi:hypothetical protein
VAALPVEYLEQGIKKLRFLVIQKALLGKKLSGLPTLRGFSRARVNPGRDSFTDALKERPYFPVCWLPLGVRREVERVVQMIAGNPKVILFQPGFKHALLPVRLDRGRKKGDDPSFHQVGAVNPQSPSKRLVDFPGLLRVVWPNPSVHEIIHDFFAEIPSIIELEIVGILTRQGIKDITQLGLYIPPPISLIETMLEQQMFDLGVAPVLFHDFN